MALTIKNVNKSYLVNKKEIKILKNINLFFPDKGLCFICGKSGSGKTTLLNLISKIDKDYKGEISYQGNDIRRFNEKETSIYRNNEIGLIFQNFNLIEDLTVFDNIIINSHVFENKNELNLDSYLKLVGLDKNILFKKVNVLSGGEKQRVAILRSIVNKPNILLADEPSGSLDIVNSHNVLKILKEISKDRLVIVVSHNEDLVNKYKDYVIYLKDGSVQFSDLPNIENKSKKCLNKNLKFSNKWIYKFSVNKLKNKKSKSFLSAITCLVSLIFMMLISGFVLGSKEATSKEGEKQLDYFVTNVTKEVKSITSSSLNLVKQQRPIKEEIENINDTFSQSFFDYDLSFFLNNQNPLILDNFKIDEYRFTPVLNFSNDYINKDLLIKGEFPNQNKFNEIIVNQSFEQKLNRLGYKDIIGLNLNYTFQSKISAKLNDLSEIEGFFEINESFLIKGVVKEFHFLRTPKIYYSYSSFKDILNAYTINNENIYAYELLEKISPLDPISCYRFLAFSNINVSKEYMEKMMSYNKDSIKFNSESFMKVESFLDLIDAASIGLSLFVIIAILGSALIIGILSFSSYSEDKKDIAILFSLGFKKDQILNIYTISNILLTLIAITLSLLLFPLCAFLLNHILLYFVGIPQLISYLIYPLSLKNILILIILFIGTLLISFLSVNVPIVFGSGLNLREELKHD